MKKKKVEFSSHTGNLAPMRKFVRGFLAAYRLSEKERTLMVLGVDEACTNVIRHAYHLRDDQLISLSSRVCGIVFECDCAITANNQPALDARPIA